MSDVTAAWNSVHRSASTGMLKFDPQAAINAARACADLIERLLGMRQAISEAGLDDMVTITSVDGNSYLLPSGAQLTRAFEAKARDLAEAVAGHVEVVTDMGETFVWAGKTYIGTDDVTGTLLTLNNLTMPTTGVPFPLDLDAGGLGDPATWPGKLDGVLTDAGLAGTGDDYYTVEAFGFDEWPESGPEYTRDVTTASTVRPENAAQLGFGHFFELGQNLAEDTKRVVLAALGWRALTKGLYDAWGDFRSAMGTVNTRWEGVGAQGAKDALRRWSTTFEPMIYAAQGMGLVMEYTADWLGRTYVSMPQQDIAAQLTAANAQSVLDHYREEWHKHYANGIVASAAALPVIEGPDAAGSAIPRRTQEAGGGDESGLPNPGSDDDPVFPGGQETGGAGDLPQFGSEQEAFDRGFADGRAGEYGAGQFGGSNPLTAGGQEYGAAERPGTGGGYGTEAAPGDGGWQAAAAQAAGFGSETSAGETIPAARTPTEGGAAPSTPQLPAAPAFTPGAGLPAASMPAGSTAGSAQSTRSPVAPAEPPTMADALAELTGVAPEELPEALRNTPVRSAPGATGAPSMADALAQLTGVPAEQMPRQLRDMPLAGTARSASGVGSPGSSLIQTLGDLAAACAQGIEALLQLVGIGPGTLDESVAAAFSPEQLERQLGDLVNPRELAGALGGGGGGGGGGGLPAPLGAAGPATPLTPYHEARVDAFPRASVAAPAAMPAAYHGAAESGQPGGSGMPMGGMGAGGMGGGSGGSQNEHKPGQYLNSKEHLEEVFDDSPNRVKPVIDR
ncbi:hypothetical protein [Nocardia sp. NPDC057353]|uniref:hypothetical protein n=1 Tax=Nocardia sp. NPDC057353 TaxID=3346104 RepID=UPI003644C1CA